MDWQLFWALVAQVLIGALVLYIIFIPGALIVSFIRFMGNRKREQTKKIQ